MGCANIDGINPKQCRRFTKRLNKRLSTGIRFEGEPEVEPNAHPPSRKRKKGKQKQAKKKTPKQQAPTTRTTAKKNTFTAQFDNVLFTAEKLGKGKTTSIKLTKRVNNKNNSVDEDVITMTPQSKNKFVGYLNGLKHTIQVQDKKLVLAVQKPTGGVRKFSLQTAQPPAGPTNIVAVTGGAREAAYQILFPGLSGGQHSRVKTRRDVFDSVRAAFRGGDAEAIRATEAAAVLLTDRPLTNVLGSREEALSECERLFL